MLKGLISTVLVSLAAAEGKSDAIPTPLAQTDPTTCDYQCLVTYLYDQNQAEYERCLDACNPPAPVDCTTCQPCGSERDSCSWGCLVTYMYD